MRFLTNISWCAQHGKGFGNPINEELHAKWLWECVEHLDSLAYQYSQQQLVVSITGFRGILHHWAGPERDYLWKVWDKAKIISVDHNPGHHQGCCWAIRMGLEACSKTGIDYMVHTAEDVVPHKGAIAKLLGKLEEGYDYAGMPWGHHNEYLNAQFFACRVESIVADFDQCKVDGDMHSERYLKSLFEGKRVWMEPSHYCYWHTHDYSEWKGFLEKVK
jgi:hypothetical protein